MKKINNQFTNLKATGTFVTFKNETYYKIENFNTMENFFMTLTSSSDVWNFLWSQGGITAGRQNSEYALFPYYTADKVSDIKHCTGSFTAIKIKQDKDIFIWIPFADVIDWNIQRNIYKNRTGSKIWFEEINNELQLTFRYEWTSSNDFGLVRKAEIENFSTDTQEILILDGCRNIMPACVTSALQKDNSILVDAYKKTDLDMKTGLVMYGMSSVLTDKAEPSEGLRANTCWFSTNTPVFLSESTTTNFITTQDFPTCAQADDVDSNKQTAVLKGKRASSYIVQKLTLKPYDNKQNTANSWYQVFNTAQDLSQINALRAELANKNQLVSKLEQNIDHGQKTLEKYISLADGFQDTADLMTCVHHEANVMFNIMRGGIIADNNNINKADFLDFIKIRNTVVYKKFQENTALFMPDKPTDTPDILSYSLLGERIKETNDLQMYRLYLEYLPLTFSRRHGDPSRPWNNFSIKTQHADGSKILNYEGNWRDIFQNWEALALSYPEFTTSMIAKFLNAMTADGFNPYHISRNGLDWEVPDPDNPWSNIGYWNDHQIIYLCKLLELQSNIDSSVLQNALTTPMFSSSNVPYKIKSFSQILQNPRDTIEFDYKSNSKTEKKASQYGTDAKLICDKTENPILISMTAKLLQDLLAKMSNFIPSGGIWMNVQRPEWNDANNALAGYGLSMVTVAYLRRYISFLRQLFEKSQHDIYDIPFEIATFYTDLSNLFITTPTEKTYTPLERAIFVQKAGLLFEQERTILYSSHCFMQSKKIGKTVILNGLEAFQKHIDATIFHNKRDDGLYHSYNTLSILKNKPTNKQSQDICTMEIQHLEVMLEGQVAMLSSGAIEPEKVADLYENMKSSSLRENRQYSYTLYPNKKLPFFTDKNCLLRADAEKNTILHTMLQNNDSRIILKDKVFTNIVHFNPDFKNAAILEQNLKSILADVSTENDHAIADICLLYEKTFNHQSFTGRSGTFYAFEGLGSIYWHMVSKLLLAVQENVYASTGDTRKRLQKAYYDVRKGLGFNKTPDIYGAFPFDPYSHTPQNQGAKQPGMTGQVKEEIITRWGELGIFIKNNTVYFDPVLLRKDEFNSEGKLSFTRFGCTFTYSIASQATIANCNSKQTSLPLLISVNDAEYVDSQELTAKDSKQLFMRNGKIKTVKVKIPAKVLL